MKIMKVMMAMWWGFLLLFAECGSSVSPAQATTAAPTAADHQPAR